MQAAPLGATGLMLTALIKLDTVMLSVLSGGDNTEVGYYSAAYRLVEATLFVSWSFTHAMLPPLARAEPSDVSRLTALGFKALTLVLTPIGIGLMLFADPIVELFYGPSFDKAVAPLQLLGAMSVFYGVSFFSAAILVARGAAGAFVRPALLVLAQNLVANLILIPLMGATGAALNAVISGILLSAVGIRADRRESGTFSLTRAFGSPLVGGAAMAAITLAIGLPLIPAAILAVVTYVAAVAAFERLVFPADAKAALATLRRRGDPTPPTA